MKHTATDVIYPGRGFRSMSNVAQNTSLTSDKEYNQHWSTR